VGTHFASTTPEPECDTFAITPSGGGLTIASGYGASTLRFASQAAVAGRWAVYPCSRSSSGKHGGLWEYNIDQDWIKLNIATMLRRTH
jgi:hypothetical protein